MGRKVLVLNADYSAISLCTVPKAFLLVYLDKAELVASSDNGLLRTVNTNYPMPSIIRLNRYVNIPYKGVVLSRHNIFKRDGNSCCYCDSKKDLTLDHVMPKSRGEKQLGLISQRLAEGVIQKKAMQLPKKPKCL